MYSEAWIECKLASFSDYRKINYNVVMLFIEVNILTYAYYSDTFHTEPTKYVSHKRLTHIHNLFSTSNYIRKKRDSS